MKTTNQVDSDGAFDCQVLDKVSTSHLVMRLENEGPMLRQTYPEKVPVVTFECYIYFEKHWLSTDWLASVEEQQRPEPHFSDIQ